MNILNTRRRPVPESVRRTAIDMWKQSGRLHRTPVIGCSMLPLLAEGDNLLIAYGHEGIQRGDVVVFQQRNRLVAHRVIRIHHCQSIPTYLTKGDNTGRFDSPVGAHDVLGRVLVIERKNRYLRLDTVRWRVLGWFIAIGTLIFRKIGNWNRALGQRFSRYPFSGSTTPAACILHGAPSLVRKATIEIFCCWKK